MIGLMMSMSIMGYMWGISVRLPDFKSYVEIVISLQPFAYCVVFLAIINPPTYRRILELDGAGDGTRTRDTLLGRQALYH
jgi:hypothetical protein